VNASAVLLLVLLKLILSGDQQARLDPKGSSDLPKSVHGSMLPAQFDVRDRPTRQTSCLRQVTLAP
jgi:hypothetical protein